MAIKIDDAVAVAGSTPPQAVSIQGLASGTALKTYCGQDVQLVLAEVTNATDEQLIYTPSSGKRAVIGWAVFSSNALNNAFKLVGDLSGVTRDLSPTIYHVSGQQPISISGGGIPLIRAQVDELIRFSTSGAGNASVWLGIYEE